MQRKTPKVRRVSTSQLVGRIVCVPRQASAVEGDLLRPGENSAWNEAISDAERLLTAARRPRAKKLKAAIQNFKANRDNGIPWPRLERIAESQSGSATHS